jgi:hypothetical protein
MSVIIGHASLSEHGNVVGTKGDQTKKEVCTRVWYSKPWSCVIRFTDPNMAKKVAECIKKACENDLIGYSQPTRNTMLNLARKHGYDPSKITEPCNTDCSALVSVACMYAGIPEKYLVVNGNCATTRTLESSLKATGEVQVFKTSDYTTKPDKLKVGDILLKTGSHVVVVVRVDDNPYTLTRSILRLGSKGESVKWLQHALNQHGANLVEDGSYGNLTKLSVLLYQRENGLQADGIAGRITLKHLKGE